MAADIAGDVVGAEFLLHQLHRGEDRPFRAAGAEARRPRGHDLRQRLHRSLSPAPAADRAAPLHRRSNVGRCASTNRLMPSSSTSEVYSPAIGSTSLPDSARCDAGLAQDRVQRLLEEVRLAFLDHQHGALAAAEFARGLHRPAGRSRSGRASGIRVVPHTSASPSSFRARMTPLYMPPCRMMPSSSTSPANRLVQAACRG